MKYKNYFGIGVAGNFTGHLEQANEASDFTAIKVADEIQPKAIFPFYFPNLSDSFLSTYPISSSNIILPETAYDVQIEPEVALICNVVYKDKKVSELIPISFGAYNDCSIRRPDAQKISHKKTGENRQKEYQIN
jgi:2-keto-4-pentenoate hydratase/2-oxohepta-3-ene-1,7-dioic acid hydratase in catechol pathway